MNRSEAIQALRQGKTIVHQYYSEGEWLKMKNGRLITEDGFDQGTLNDSFWMNQQPFEDGWSILTQAQ